MTAKLLIVNADDCGMSRGITDGIILAHRYGVVTSTSLMTNMPASEYAVSRLAKLPSLGAGVHLNICAGKPMLPAQDVPTLVAADGHFHSPSAMIRRLWTWRASPHEIEAEFRAQIRWLMHRGIQPTHADSHHHMHIYPAAARPFARALSAEGILCARAPRSSVWPRSPEPGGPYEGPLLRRVGVQIYRGLLQRVVFRKFQMPESRISFGSRDRHDLDRLGEQWKISFVNLPAGIFELACHPGLFERGFSEADRIHLQREEELHWLTSAEFRELLDRNGIRLVTYRDIAPRPCVQTAAREAHALP